MGQPSDDVGREFAEVTYRELLDGGTLAHALHTARAETAPRGEITPYHTLMAGYANLRLVAAPRKHIRR
jgi:hypothetical protein